MVFPRFTDRRGRDVTRRLMAFTAATSVVILAGCGAGPTVEDSGTVTMQSPDGSCAVAPSDGVDYDAARELIASFQEPVTSLPVTDKLPAPIDPDTKVAFLHNQSPVSGIMVPAMQQAAAAAGVELVVVDAGNDAQSINAAVDSVLEILPDIVITEALDATFFQDQVQRLKDADIAIVYGGQPNAEQFGLDDSVLGGADTRVVGTVLAAGAIDFTCGTAQNFVFYNAPELSVSEIMLDATREKLAELCPECTLRVVDISIADPSPADKIVSDLQAHPDTEFFIPFGDQFQIGLAEKAALAGVQHVAGFGSGSLPANVEQTANGAQHAAFVTDFDLVVWLHLDEGLRKMQGAWTGYSDWEQMARTVSHVLTREQANENPGGYVALPQAHDEFLQLWGRR